MSRPHISHIQLSETLGLTECHPTANHKGAYWLYDKTQCINLAMGAQTPQDAFVEALTYYQERLRQVQTEYRNLQEKVDSFLVQFQDDEEEDDRY